MLVPRATPAAPSVHAVAPPRASPARRFPLFFRAGEISAGDEFAPRNAGSDGGMPLRSTDGSATNMYAIEMHT